jgi:hypothetical protein
MTTMLTALTVALLAADPTPSPQPIALFLSKAINLSDPEVQTFGAVCAMKFSEVTNTSVLSPEETKAALTGSNVVEATRSLGAKESIELSLVNLASGSSRGRILMAAVRRDATGRELYRSNATADSLDDALPACERLALSLDRLVPLPQTMNRHNVLRAEARDSSRPNRMGSEKSLGVKTAFTAALASTGTINPLGAISFDARLEKERYFIELSVGALFPAVTDSSRPSYGGITTEVGADYYLSDADTTGYIGVGLMPRLIFGGSIFNVAPYAQVGVVFWRQSSTRLYADVKIAQNLLPTAFDNGAVAMYPTELSGQVGIAW